jgi:hypothetical protein
MYGRIIISELHLPVEEKTIRPINVGGVLGGTKFLVRGVLFKVTNTPDRSVFANYPDPIRIANKVQGLDLLGLQAYFGWFFNQNNVGASFPMLSIIDYKGHRITAMTQLPIRGAESLVYGSADAGHDCVVKNDVPEWSELVRSASLGLNLKPHWVVNSRVKGGEIQLASCVDLEGHAGDDGRFYLLDYSRAMPPAFKDACEPHDTLWSFYHVLRPEFVARWRRPLCADGFSQFQSRSTPERVAEAKANNDELRFVTEFLTGETVLVVCNTLMGQFRNNKGVLLRSGLTHVLHAEGLNMRYLGLLYVQLMDAYDSRFVDLYMLVLLEALTRVFKNHLRSQLRLV